MLILEYHIKTNSILYIIIIIIITCILSAAKDDGGYCQIVRISFGVRCVAVFPLWFAVVTPSILGAGWLAAAVVMVTSALIAARSRLTVAPSIRSGSHDGLTASHLAFRRRDSYP